MPSFSPAMRQMYQRAAVFAAASQVSSSAPMQSSASAAQGYEGEVLRRRGDQADVNDPYIGCGLTQLRDDVRGSCRPRATNSTAANDAMNAWARRCGYRHQAGTIEQIVGLWIHHASKDGEAYLRRHQTRASARTPNGLLLQVLRVEDIAAERGEMGHEYVDGIWSGTWFRETSQTNRLMSVEAVLVDADDLSRLRLTRDADAIRGIPVHTAAIEAAERARQLQNAELHQAKLDASMQGILISKLNAYTPTSMFNPGYASLTGPAGEPLARMSPGTYAIARGVEGVQFPPRAKNEINHKEAKHRIAAGLGTVVENIGGGTSEASFSALIWANLVRMNNAERFDRDAGVAEGVQTILEWFLFAESVAAGRSWAGVRWSWAPRKAMDVQRKNGVDATVALLNAELISKQTACGQHGYDYDEQQDQIAAEASASGTEESESNGRHLHIVQ